MKFKRYKYSITAVHKFDGEGLDAEKRAGFIIQAVPVNEEQALQIAKILYPKMKVDYIEIKNEYGDENE